MHVYKISVNICILFRTYNTISFKYSRIKVNIIINIPINFYYNFREYLMEYAEESSGYLKQ